MAEQFLTLRKPLHPAGIDDHYTANEMLRRKSGYLISFLSGMMIYFIWTKRFCKNFLKNGLTNLPLPLIFLQASLVRMNPQ